MSTRRLFLGHGSLALISMLMDPLSTIVGTQENFEGVVLNDEEGEEIRMRDGSAIVRIKIAKTSGVQSISFISESFRPGDRLPIHKHMNEDELIFLHKGSGLFTLGDKQYSIKEGAVAFVPRGVWHGLENTGTENIEMRFGYSPAGFEGFFREMGTPAGQSLKKRSKEERAAIAKKMGDGL